MYRETVELCRRAEAMGASWITVHGRTPLQRTEPVNSEAIRLIADSVSLPVVANGDVTTLDDALSLVDICHVKGRCPVFYMCVLLPEYIVSCIEVKFEVCEHLNVMVTKCCGCVLTGVMAARGLLSNPALFAGHNQVPIECISEWV